MGANPTCDNTDGGNTAFGQSDCDAGFTIKSTLAGVICGSDTCVTSDCCDINSCTATEVANSNKKTIGAITGNTGDTTLVTCDTGCAGTPTFTATCGTSGTFNAITCTAEACTTANVANSDKASGTADITGSTGDAVTITCDAGYSGSGAGFPTATCGTGGTFNPLICATMTVEESEEKTVEKSVEKAPSPGLPGSPGSPGSSKTSGVSPMYIIFIILACVAVCFAMFACCHHKKKRHRKTSNVV